VLQALRRIEARGAIETAHRVKDACGQVFRYGVATGRCERDPCVDLRGALPPAKGGHFAATTDPKRVGEILRAMDGYEGSMIVRSAMRLAPLVFVRPGELRAAHWEEIDLACGEWRYMVTKTRTPHIVPLATHPERLLNAHWLNPAYVIPLVELSVHAGTAPEVVERLRAMLEDIGKVPVTCGPAPGYIVPRLQALIMNEAARMIEEGVATAEDIDRATRNGLGLRFAAIGVVEFIDFGGNDILYHASRYLADTLSRERYTAPAIVDRMMHAGHNGLRSGRGFYDYSGRDIDAYRKDVLSRTLAMLRHAGLQRPPR
jgi:3-hydroxybutyryl-CoA dehydrogenase